MSTEEQGWQAVSSEDEVSRMPQVKPTCQQNGFTVSVTRPHLQMIQLANPAPLLT